MVLRRSRRINQAATAMHFRMSLIPQNCPLMAGSYFTPPLRQNRPGRGLPHPIVLTIRFGGLAPFNPAGAVAYTYTSKSVRAGNSRPHGMGDYNSLTPNICTPVL